MPLAADTVSEHFVSNLKTYIQVLYFTLTWLTTTNVVFIGHFHDGDLLLLTTLLDFAHSIYIRARVNYSQLLIWLTLVGVASPFRERVRPNEVECPSHGPRDVSSSSSSSATYCFINLVDITSCFQSLVAAEDDKLDRTSKIPPCLIN